MKTYKVEVTVVIEVKAVSAIVAAGIAKDAVHLQFAPCDGEQLVSTRKFVKDVTP